ncbi:rRNA pseudouridine synthase [Actinomyces sp. zg-332]|uniref:pseudouridine synthase n=1 Tax=Actinomyces sp. zg-332 TaxID=2708340 RepID=UPI0014214E68|nr:pseudouridine synthase [Actinomyces sp. zg-332]QPK94687.1 rRNA pseudouridine synthase [Actinomyces sp. zg-332]
MEKENTTQTGVRLQKVLSSAGVASRRASEILISKGRVTVNNKTVTQLGTRVDPEKDIIHVDGMRIVVAKNHLVLALNKPKGVVSTMFDPQGRYCLADYIEKYDAHLHHVGRLDTDTEGLILLTNDGELSHRLSHPSHKVKKTYVATVEGVVPKGLGPKLKKGVVLDDGFVSVDSFVLKGTDGQTSIIELVLHEGRNRIVRRMLDHVGFPVIKLMRTKIGPIKLGQLKSGRTRVITGPELSSLMKEVGL